MTPQKISETIETIWNKKAKFHGWPTRVSKEQILRKGRLLQKINKFAGDTDPTESISWILQRWNWNKSPAPMELLESDAQWRTLESLKRTLQEEEAETQQNRFAEIQTWTQKEFEKYCKTETPVVARKRVAEFAKASGKTQGWNNTEKDYFEELLTQIKKAP
jgi:hypothetical protein